MFERRITDYTAMPMGTTTKHGIIEGCEHCGRHGAHRYFVIPNGSIDKWMHVYKPRRRLSLTANQSNDECTYIELSADGQITSGWSRSKLREIVPKAPGVQAGKESVRRRRLKLIARR